MPWLQDPCTWRIVLKNTVDLEPLEVQAAAKEKMDALVLSYQHLDSLLDMAREGNAGGFARACSCCCDCKQSLLAACRRTNTSTTGRSCGSVCYGGGGAACILAFSRRLRRVDCRGCYHCCCCCTHHADAVPKAQEQIKETMVIAADIESFVKQTLGV